MKWRIAELMNENRGAAGFGGDLYLIEVTSEVVELAKKLSRVYHITTEPR